MKTTITEAEGYETVKCGLELLLAETRKQIESVVMTKNAELKVHTDERDRLNAKVSELVSAIGNIQTTIDTISLPYKLRIEELDNKVGKIEATMETMAKALARKGKVAIAKKLDKKVVPETEEISDSEGFPSWIVKGVCQKPEDVMCNLGIACDACPYQKHEPKMPEIPEDAPVVEEKVKAIGSHDKKWAGKKIVGLVENALKEGAWETRQTIGKRLIAAGYPSKHTDLYASKALNQLKNEGKAVAHRQGQAVFWRHALRTNLRFTGGK